MRESTGHPPGLGEESRKVWEALAGGPTHLDELALRLGLAVPRLRGHLLELELQRLVRRLPGDCYQRWG
jgi:DNA processing protein